MFVVFGVTCIPKMSLSGLASKNTVDLEPLGHQISFVWSLKWMLRVFVIIELITKTSLGFQLLLFCNFMWNACLGTARLYLFPSDLKYCRHIKDAHCLFGHICPIFKRNVHAIIKKIVIVRCTRYIVCPICCCNSFPSAIFKLCCRNNCFAWCKLTFDTVLFFIKFKRCDRSWF